MAKKITTSLDYRRLADEIWEKSRKEAEAGFHPLSVILMELSDHLHDVARKKVVEEENLKKNILKLN